MMNLLNWTLWIERSVIASVISSHAHYYVVDASIAAFDLHLVTFNIQHIPGLSGWYYPTSSNRVDRIPQLEFVQHHDVLLFNEAFTFQYDWLQKHSAIFTTDLHFFQSQFKGLGFTRIDNKNNHDLPTASCRQQPEPQQQQAAMTMTDKSTILDSGIDIYVRQTTELKINHERTIQKTYKDCCGFDCLSSKGYKYIELLFTNTTKKDKEDDDHSLHIGIIATHLQAPDSACGITSSNPFLWWMDRKKKVMERFEQVYQSQVNELASFIHQIRTMQSFVDVLLLVGDLNAVRGTDMAQRAFAQLGVSSSPLYINEQETSIDPMRNSYAQALNSIAEHLDYGVILQCSNTKTCTITNQVVQDAVYPDGEFITYRGKRIHHFSDHDPVSIHLRVASTTDDCPNNNHTSF